MNPLDSNELLKAVERLASGDVIGLPTETVYGLAASIQSEAGLRKIFALKERPFFDPLIVHVASFHEAAQQAREWPDLVDYLTRVFWPGPLTVIVPKAAHINSLITSGLETVGLRYPSHPVAQDLIHLLGSPVAAPSANKFGRTSPSCAVHVEQEFAGTDLLVIDGGACEVGIESTVITVDDKRRPALVQILRPGGISVEQIQHALSRWSHPTEVVIAASNASPGHTPHHYMPSIPLVIARESDNHGLSFASKAEIKKLLGKEFRRPEELLLNDNPAIAARELYAEMRRLSESGADLLFVRATSVQTHDQASLWQAIWDRLTRAATLKL